MTDRDIHLISTLWLRIVGNTFEPQELMTQVLHDGGHDMKNISAPQLLQLLEGRFTGDWRRVGFSFSETLASYGAGIQLGIKPTDKEIVGWVFSTFAIADAIQQGVIELEPQFDNIINGYLAVRDQLMREESVYIFRRILISGKGT